LGGSALVFFFETLYRRYQEEAMIEKRQMSADIDNYSEGFSASLDKAISEAVVNSLHAKALNIQVIAVNDENGILTKIVVVDDGEGFQKQNIDSFFDLHSKLKKNKGGKGVGRISWLKHFSYVSVYSNYKEDDKWKKTSFILIPNKRDTDVSTEPSKITRNETVIELIDYKGEKLHNIIPINLKQFLITETAILLLKIIDKQNQNINIKIISEFNNQIQDQAIITNSDIPTIHKSFPFSIKFEGENHPFTLNCIRLETSEKNNVITGFVAGDRTLSSFNSALSLNIHAPTSKYTGQYWFLLESPLFNSGRFSTQDRVNIKFPDKTDLWGGNLRDQIRTNVAASISKYFDQIAPTHKDERERVLGQIYKLYPQYNSDEYQEIIRTLTVEEIGRLDKHKILQKLHQFDFEKEYTFKTDLTKLLESRNFQKKTIDETVELAERTSEQARGVLANYFWFRKAIISQLSSYSNNNEKSEDLLHELFFKRYKTVAQASLKNCIWLLDDKFMRFLYFASEGIIKNVISDIYGPPTEDHNSGKRMDLFIKYDRPESSDKKDCVIIEFKALGTTADEKANAASQVRRKYAASIRKYVPSINNIFVYIITNIDDNLAKDLKSDDFTEAFTRHGYILNFYNQANRANISFISASSIVADAEDRHDLFFKLLQEDMSADTRLAD
jgi:hypothetical protein